MTIKSFISRRISLIVLSVLLALAIFNLLLPIAEAGNTLWDLQQGKDELASPFSEDARDRDPRGIAAGVIRVFLGFLGIIFISLIIYGGFKYMTAGGDDDEVRKAKSLIKRAIFGVVIIICAYAITYAIFEMATEGIFEDDWFR